MRYYGDERETLHGVLADDAGTAVYPEDRCPECEREGRITADERCFHRHWRVADEPGYEKRHAARGRVSREERR